ncbi:MAG: hypothetical protein HY321_01525, partial [Armatimonadetes bacterium]|nr:hypothetical protein [Armatimonadota bacterium]
RRDAGGDPVTVDLTYQRVQGKYWLPSRSVARMKLPASAPAAGVPDATGPDSRPPLPRQGSEGAAERVPGTVTVIFRNYRINTGLADSLFDAREERPVPLRRHHRRRWRP